MIMQILEKLRGKLKKWEPPTPRKGVQNEVSIDRKGIDILSWASGYFRGYKEVDLFYDERSFLGVKPVAKGHRRLSPKKNARGFFVACTPLMREIGVDEKKRVPAQWSEKRKMLIVDLKGVARRLPAGARVKSQKV
jgi:hypothetical protein